MHSAAGVIGPRCWVLQERRIDDYAPELPRRMYGVCEETVKGLGIKTLHLQPCNMVQ